MKCLTILGSTLTLLAASAVAAPAASACGSLPSPVLAFVASEPADGAVNVPRDHPLLFRFACDLPGDWQPIVREASCSHLPQDTEVTLRVRGGASVAGRIARFGEELTFLPSITLEADTEYEFSATLPEHAASLSERPTIKGSFRTAKERLPALSDAAPSAEIRIEWYDAPVAQCSEVRLVGDEAREALGPFICPGPYRDCKAAGDAKARRARVRLGPFAGGLSSRGYAVELRLTDQTAGAFDIPRVAVPAEENPQQPHEFARDVSAVVREGEVAELLVDLPSVTDLDTPICMRVRASDAAAHVVSDQTKCIAYRTLIAETPATGVQTGKPATGATDDRDQDSAQAQAATSEAASCSAGSHGSPVAWFVLLLAGMLARRRSRPIGVA